MTRLAAARGLLSARHRLTRFVQSFTSPVLIRRFQIAAVSTDRIGSSLTAASEVFQTEAGCHAPDIAPCLRRCVTTPAMIAVPVDQAIRPAEFASAADSDGDLRSAICTPNKGRSTVLRWVDTPAIDAYKIASIVALRAVRRSGENRRPDRRCGLVPDGCRVAATGRRPATPRLAVCRGRRAVEAVVLSYHGYAATYSAAGYR